MAQEHVHVFATMLPHVVEVNNSVNGISTGTLNSKMVTIALTRHVVPLLTHVVRTDLSSMSASPAMDRHAIHGPSEGQISAKHTVMVPPGHAIVSSLRGITNTSITMLHLAHGILQNAHPALIESATRRQNVM